MSQKKRPPDSPNLYKGEITMAAENVKKILEALQSDPRAQELIKAVERPEDIDGELRIYAEVASELGYDITSEELKDYMEKAAALTTQKTETAASQIEELPDEVLDKVAGGKKDHDTCKDTYKDKENCWVNDGCDNIFNKYDDYVCHIINWDDPCHSTAKPCKNDQYCNYGPNYL